MDEGMVDEGMVEKEWLEIGECSMSLSSEEKCGDGHKIMVSFGEESSQSAQCSPENHD